ncbi:chaperone modulatory protein CbpM [Nitrosospira multiformis]|uniref:Chaperone modulatory protein CbpM n=1 Tax=Nitrosospira multiformis TaxID=1231 RepID=A0A1I0CTS7_9PROT|nr:chaperone modulator CbpM [Nitrosospira multiformis]SET23202.1 chaperone modulatory protein CbpM [Nitrosospira multiformis]
MSDENDHRKNAPSPPPELSVTLVDEQNALTLAELSHACSVQSGYIIELVDEGLITPQIMAEEHEPHCWRFTGAQIRRTRMALRLQSDLGINLAGVALALQLLDEIEALQMRLNVLDNW